MIAAPTTQNHPRLLVTTSRLSMKAIRSAIRRRRSRSHRRVELSRCSMTGSTLTGSRRYQTGATNQTRARGRRRRAARAASGR
jgi:hypothetical protein